MKKYFLKDASLTKVDDDQLRYQDLANNLRRMIENNETPFNIAIIGKWGLGKSSVINMALNSLANDKKDYLICNINAWKYEKDEIGKAFIRELWEKISNKKALSFTFFHRDYSEFVKKTLSDENTSDKKERGHNYKQGLVLLMALILVGSLVAFGVYCWISNTYYGIYFQGKQFLHSSFLRYCKNIGSILIIPLIVWLGKLNMDKLNASPYTNYEINFPLQAKEDYMIYLENLLENKLKEENKKVIVVIDDLDRLSANKIVEALDALKLFMEYDRFIFIVPFDDEILKAVIKQSRIDKISTLEGEYDGEMILDKLFQYRIYLPQLIRYDMRNYAFEICKKECTDFIVEYCNNDYSLFEEIIGRILIHNDVTTPRQVKKIINAFVENVLIASDREYAGKVSKGFVKERGLQTIAKISVLQADFNEFYDLLFQDVSIMEEILVIHRSNGQKKPSELIKAFFDSNNLLKKKYVPLLNYLIVTEHLGYSNIVPYLYLAQTKEGAIVGDEKQRQFMTAIESCNFVMAKQLIEESSILISLFLNEIKYNNSPRLGNIIVSAIDSYSILSEENKKEFANPIVSRIADIANDYRFDLINEENLIDVCRAANDSKEYNSLVINAIYKEKAEEDHRNRVLLIKKISKIRERLSENALNEFDLYVKGWITSEEAQVSDIMDYTSDENVDNIAKNYGKEYIQKISKYITDNDVFDDKLIEQFGNIVRLFLQENSFDKIIDDLFPCFDYPLLYKMLDNSVQKEKYDDISDKERWKIANKIVEIGVTKHKGIYAYNILAKLSYTVEAGKCSIFDQFFLHTVGETQFADMIIAYAQNNILATLPDTIQELIDCVFESTGYAPDIRKLLRYFSSVQKKNFWERLRTKCEYLSTEKYEEQEKLVFELSDETEYNSDIIDIIENIIIPEVENYYSRKDYFIFAIHVINAYRDLISQKSIDRYSRVLTKAIDIDTEHALNAYKIIHGLLSSGVWCENILLIFNYVNKDTFRTVYGMVCERIDLFNVKNNNLKVLERFLVNNIGYSENPDDVINTICQNLFQIEQVDQLIHQLMQLECDDKVENKLAKYIDACDFNVIIEIILNEWNMNDKNKMKLDKILSCSVKYSRESLVCELEQSKENLSKTNLLYMLSFCEGAITNRNIDKFTNIIQYILSLGFEKDICSSVLILIENLPQKIVTLERKNLCRVLVEIFLTCDSDENRRKSARLIKEKKLTKDVRQQLDDNEMRQYKAYLEQ